MCQCAIWEFQRAGRSSEGLFTCALAATAARARAAKKSFMVVVSILEGGGWNDSDGRDSVGLIETMKD